MDAIYLPIALLFFAAMNKQVFGSNAVLRCFVQILKIVLAFLTFHYTMESRMADEKRRLFVETTIPSLATARTSFDVITAGRQESTKYFWEKERHKYLLFVSQDVLDECALGDPWAAKRRLEFLSGIPVLPKTREMIELAFTYQKILEIPERAMTDSLHLSTSVLTEMHYLLSWNFAHFGIRSYEKLREYNDGKGLKTPFLIAPDALIETEEEKHG